MKHLISTSFFFNFLKSASALAAKSNLHEDTCLLSIQIKLQAVCQEILGKTGHQKHLTVFEGVGIENKMVQEGQEMLP